MDSIQLAVLVAMQFHADTREKWNVWRLESDSGITRLFTNIISLANDELVINGWDDVNSKRLLKAPTFAVVSQEGFVMENGVYVTQRKLRYVKTGINTWVDHSAWFSSNFEM